MHIPEHERIQKGIYKKMIKRWYKRLYKYDSKIFYTKKSTLIKKKEKENKFIFLTCNDKLEKMT